MGQHIRAFFGRPPRMGFGPCGSFRLTTFSRMRTNDAKRGTWQANIGTLRVARSLFHMLHALRHALTRVGESTTHPAAFAVVAAYAAAWLFFSPDTFGWAAIATLATWLMTLFINRTEHRDTQAIHAKIDELLRTQGKARAELTTLDERDVEDIEEHRRRHRGYARGVQVTAKK